MKAKRKIIKGWAVVFKDGSPALRDNGFSAISGHSLVACRRFAKELREHGLRATVKKCAITIEL